MKDNQQISLLLNKKDHQKAIFLTKEGLFRLSQLDLNRTMIIFSFPLEYENNLIKIKDNLYERKDFPLYIETNYNNYLYIIDGNKIVVYNNCLYLDFESRTNPFIIYAFNELKSKEINFSTEEVYITQVELPSLETLLTNF